VSFCIEAPHKKTTSIWIREGKNHARNHHQWYGPERVSVHWLAYSMGIEMTIKGGVGIYGLEEGSDGEWNEVKKLSTLAGLMSGAEGYLRAKKLYRTCQA